MTQGKPITCTLKRRNRRDFISLTLVSGTCLIFPNTGKAEPDTFLAEKDDPVREITIADTILLYVQFLDEIRRLVLRYDAGRILDSKIDIYSELGGLGGEVRSLLEKFPKSSDIKSDSDKAAVYRILSRVANDTDLLQGALLGMRRGPLNEIERLDKEIDGIRASLVGAADSLKTINKQNKEKNLEQARQSILSAIESLSIYSSSRIEAWRADLEREFGTKLITPKELKALLTTVHDSLSDARVSRLLSNSSQYQLASYLPGVSEEVLEDSIGATIRNVLNPGSWLQIAIGYAVCFPILVRVGNKADRVKLLNDALRLIPPGLRDPKLSELADALAQHS